MHDFEEIGTHYNGRPHWGKEFTVNKNYLLVRHWLKLANFLTKQEKNGFYRRLLGAHLTLARVIPLKHT
jgi:hypothetical protein